MYGLYAPATFEFDIQNPVIHSPAAWKDRKG